MLSALLGRKIGMTQILDAVGRMVPVTVLEAGPCDVLQVKTERSDGYGALQIGFADLKRAKAAKPLLGTAAKAGVEPKRFIREIPTDDEQHEPGERITVEIFNETEFVDVVGISKGKGFAGVIKRWHFKGQPKTHGASGRRVPGSIGQSAYPARVLKGTKMAGHMGARRVMTKGLEVIKVEPEKNLILVKGSVPGHNGGYVMVAKSAEWTQQRKKRKH